MQEVKSPKKPFLYYCLIVATIMVLLNSLVFPNVLEHSVKEVDYNTFMKMTENKEIGKVNIDSGRSSLRIRVKRRCIRPVLWMIRVW